MKKIFGFMALALAFIGVSCNQEKNEIEDIEKIPSVTITAGIEGEAARTVLDGFKVLWSGEEKFNVLTTGDQKATFAASVAEPSATAEFTTITEGFTGEEYLAHYPASVSATMDLANKTVETCINHEQKPVAGSMDPTAAPMVAYAATTNFSFKNTVALAKFTVTEEGVTDVQLVADDALAGNYTYNVEAQSTTISQDNVSKTIQVVPATGSTFVKDQSYYVAIIPGNKANLKLNVNGVTTKEVASFEFTRNKIYNLGTVAPFVAEATKWGLVGELNNWGANNSDIMFYTTPTTGLLVATNVTFNKEYCEFKIRENHSWNTAAYTSEVYGIEANKWVVASNNKDLGNTSVMDAGTYDVYLDTANSHLYVMTAGTPIEEAVEQTISNQKPVESAGKLYLVPNSNWKIDNARFAAYFFGNGERWLDMTDTDKDGCYECEVPAGFPNVIFCRMNPSTTANNWNNKWNQTADLTVPTDGTNCYTVKAGTWDKGGGTWSTK